MRRSTLEVKSTAFPIAAATAHPQADHMMQFLLDVVDIWLKVGDMLGVGLDTSFDRRLMLSDGRRGPKLGGYPVHAGSRQETSAESIAVGEHLHSAACRPRVAGRDAWGAPQEKCPALS